MTGFALLSTTVAREADARALARKLVEEGLVACVQIVPVVSIYRWEEAIEEGAEHLLLCKIATGAFTAVEATIRRHHTYEVPEIVVTPITGGSASYLAWLAASTIAPPK